MRALIPLLALASPAAAWEFSAQPFCTLSHETNDARIEVRHDPRAAEPYALTLTRKGDIWPAAPLFAMRFDGPRPQTITTGRHRLSADAGSLTVTDKGFGNVLQGLGQNFVAMAILGDQALLIPLDGAAPKVKRFLDCLSAPAT